MGNGKWKKKGKLKMENEEWNMRNGEWEWGMMNGK